MLFAFWFSNAAILFISQFWILSVIRQRVSRYIKCFRYNGPSLNPIMGSLPASGDTQGRPFVNVGLEDVKMLKLLRLIWR